VSVRCLRVQEEQEEANLCGSLDVQGFRLGERCGVVNREAKQEALSGSQVLVPEIRVLHLCNTGNSESER